ncbi:hypothetical protein BGW36DRAFT_356220 [Talaromyces proteolyticus]|uniref:Lytic polysaccharide monooxygenase n=1 Tax=Talaromyces proteolyticus TaxID=1131652 RepID=A0AAD4Q1A6_9EURO|nr:uncharacterized protein BGW36DRAFT_356220 [Talaromyces proteolyticus]KAH8702079.1 hypothetical protein BGW36DRAFT_356220 [Talaromyces proteolyticus]
MIMNTPYPFGDGLNNSPLAADGSDFPCKQRGDKTYFMETGDPLGKNRFPVGSNQTLSFTGSAVHGGGSCQISLTTDLTPSKASQWFVIHSIEGGCPAMPATIDQNLPANPSGNGASTFEFTIPDIAVGRYTLAWTWFNRIGNREMYMNCAPIEVTHLSTKRSDIAYKRANEYPEMFVANIGGCTTKENFDIRFPNPGDSVQYAGNPSNLLPSDSPACVGGAGITATGLIPAPSPTATGAVTGGTSSGGTSNPPSGGSSGDTPKVAPTTDSPGMFLEHTATTIAVVPTSPPTSGGPSPESSTTSSTNEGLTGACTNEGEWNCIGGHSFQRCASGTWSAIQSVAAGTSCTPGQSAVINIVATKRGHVEMHRRRFAANNHVHI